MKNIIFKSIIFIFILGISTMSATNDTKKAQNTQETSKQYFVFLYHRGPAWDENKTMFEQPLQGHFDYMNQLEEKSILIVGGPFKDGSGAMGIIETTDLGKAAEIIKNDPGIVDELFTSEIKPWHPAVIGTLKQKEW